MKFMIEYGSESDIRRLPFSHSNVKNMNAYSLKLHFLLRNLPKPSLSVMLVLALRRRMNRSSRRAQGRTSF